MTQSYRDIQAKASEEKGAQQWLALLRHGNGPPSGPRSLSKYCRKAGRDRQAREACKADLKPEPPLPL